MKCCLLIACNAAHFFRPFNRSSILFTRRGCFDLFGRSRMRQLRIHIDAAVAARWHRSLPVQRLRTLPQDEQRHQSAAPQTAQAIGKTRPHICCLQFCPFDRYRYFCLCTTIDHQLKPITRQGRRSPKKKRRSIQKWLNFFIEDSVRQLVKQNKVLT